MSEVMQGVLNMPPELWRGDPLDIAQRHGYYKSAWSEIEQLRARIAELEQENARLIEDRTRFSDRPDDIGRMIGAHIGNLKSAKSSSDKYAAKYRDERDAAQRRIAELEAQLEAKHLACEMLGEKVQELNASIDKLVDELEAQRVPECIGQLIEDIRGLIEESEGVTGLHLNGDIAPWEELLPGGRFERLSTLNEAEAVYWPNPVVAPLPDIGNPITETAAAAEREVFENRFPSAKGCRIGLGYTFQRDQDRWEAWQARAQLGAAQPAQEQQL